jgi:phage terminase small subunit
VPTLRNPRHEKFAQELAAGKTADAAYVLAGYCENRSNAARLNANPGIQKRVAEIQSVGAERAAVTAETLIAEAESARKKAMADKGGAAAAVAAITAKAKLAAATDSTYPRSIRSELFYTDIEKRSAQDDGCRAPTPPGPLLFHRIWPVAGIALGLIAAVAWTAHLA